MIAMPPFIALFGKPPRPAAGFAARNAALVVAVLTTAALALAGCGSDPASVPARPAPPALESYFPLAALDDGALCDRLLARTAGDSTVYSDPAIEHRRKVIVSDLHLGPGPHAGPRFAGIEDFSFATEWAHFLTQQGQQGATDLIIAGDFIEFWQVLTALDRLPRRDNERDNDSDSELQPGPAAADSGPLLASDQQSALEALEYVLVAHGEVFTAIGRFVDSGDHRAIFLPGNHDAELLWPRVQLAIARAIGAREPARLVFVDAVAYHHGGVHVEHGHRFDDANRFASDHAPFGRDATGRCRLQSSWGEVFVARFFTDTERELPFIDNLYPESAAVAWGLRDEPDLALEAITVARFLDLIVSAQSREFNASALRGVVRSAVGLPSTGKPGKPGFSTRDEVIDHVTGRLFGAGGTERVLDALMQLLHDPELRQLWTGLAAAAGHLPDARRAFSELRKVDPAALDVVRALLFGEPMTTAAGHILEAYPAIRVVVVGHTHAPGGAVTAISAGENIQRTGYYANSGAWIPVTTVADLQARGITWSDLSLRDRTLFPASFPAVVIEYDGQTPRPPAIVRASEATGP